MAGKTQDNNQIHIRLICLAPPPAQHEGRATEFGLQDKAQALQYGIALPDGSLQFDCDVTVSKLQGATPRYGGPYAHGTPGDQFLYLGWRPRGAEKGAWHRRGKVSLHTITRQQIERAASNAEWVLQGIVRGLDAARLELLDDGWTVVQG